MMSMGFIVNFIHWYDLLNPSQMHDLLTPNSQPTPNPPQTPMRTQNKIIYASYGSFEKHKGTYWVVISTEEYIIQYGGEISPINLYRGSSFDAELLGLLSLIQLITRTTPHI